MTKDTRVKINGEEEVFESLRMGHFFMEKSEK